MLSSILIFTAGSIVNMIAYLSFSPFLVGCLFLFAALALLNLLSTIDKGERQAFVLSFSASWFWAGVAAVYANFFDDLGQNELDAIYFFEIVTEGEAATLNAMDTLLFIENGGAMIIWRIVYDFFFLLGFEKAPYIGVTLNICLVALTCIVGIKMVKVVFGNDVARIRRFTMLYVLCGLFWLYASIHLRDAAVLFSVTLLTLFWLYFLAKPGVKNAALLTVTTIVALLFFGFLRREFVFVPFAMICAGTASFVFASRDNSRGLKVLIAASVLAIPAGTYLYMTLKNDLIESLEVGNEAYSGLSFDEEESGSLGTALIVYQPLPVRLLFGSAYLLVFPIPFWVGFQLDSAYHLFKSLHVLFMYAVTPLFVLSVLRILWSNYFKTRQILFLTFVVFGFLLSIAYTSLETRHIGSFFVSLLVLSVLPDLTRNVDRRAYHILLSLFLALMTAIHLAWLVLKVGI